MLDKGTKGSAAGTSEGDSGVTQRHTYADDGMTREQALDWVRRAIDELGTQVNAHQYERWAHDLRLHGGRPPSAYFLRRFGGFAGLRAEVGGAPKSRGYSADQVIAMLRAAEDDHGSVAGITAACRRHFGSYVQARRAAGLPDRRIRRRFTVTRANSSRRYSDVEMVEALRAANDGRSVTVVAYMEWTARRPSQPTHGAIMDRFGSWLKAHEAAGLPVTARQRAWARRETGDWRETFTLDDLGAAMRRCAEETRTQMPTFAGYGIWNKTVATDAPTNHSQRKRCGSWMAALTNAGLLIDGTPVSHLTNAA